MITAGSVSREEASLKFEFLNEQVRGRRKLLNRFTHTDPDFVFWIFPDGRLFDARDAHAKNYPKGYAYIVKDKPDYGGFLRGRVATKFDDQLIVVYCLPESLHSNSAKIRQFLDGISRLPVPLIDDALVVSDNADIYGTLGDLVNRLAELDG